MKDIGWIRDRLMSVRDEVRMRYKADVVLP